MGGHRIDAGAQALSQLIDEKPDILIFHAIDMQAYNKLIKKAVDAGINVIQINLKSPNNGDAYVGGDVTVQDLDDAIEVGDQYSGLHRFP